MHPKRRTIPRIFPLFPPLSPTVSSDVPPYPVFLPCFPAYAVSCAPYCFHVPRLLFKPEPTGFPKNSGSKLCVEQVCSLGPTCASLNRLSCPSRCQIADPVLGTTLRAIRQKSSLPPPLLGQSCDAGLRCFFFFLVPLAFVVFFSSLRVVIQGNRWCRLHPPPCALQ